jgi:hypothetical protein
MDTAIKGQMLAVPEITAIIEKILVVPVDDGMEFSLRGIQGIREEANYPGYRVSIGAVFDKTRQTLKVDITTGDFVSPREIAPKCPYPPQLMYQQKLTTITGKNEIDVVA